MSESLFESSEIAALLNDFFLNDDITRLAVDVGRLLGYPLLIINDTFRVAASYCPAGFTDSVFENAVKLGEITYEAGALISQSEALNNGSADYIELSDSPFPRRFAPLTSSEVRLGYLICVNTDGRMADIPPQTWQTVERILAKQLFIEVGRIGKPLETTEEILMHLLDGSFPSAPYFKLRTMNTYLADFRPAAFALIDLSAYHSKYLGKRYLKTEIYSRFSDSHAFVYRGNVFMFLHKSCNPAELAAMAEEFQLKILISDRIKDLFDLPALYQTARDALEMLADGKFGCGSVCSVSQMRTPLMLKRLESSENIIPPKLRELAAHDRKKETQYCETLYTYLICGCSLKKTCDMLYTHRNTVLYRIRRIREDFVIPLDDPASHTEILIGTSLILLKTKGPFFFRPVDAPECFSAQRHARSAVAAIAEEVI